MSATTWGKWFWPDWLSDPALRASSFAARGLWMDLLCIAAQANPVGHLVINGRALTPDDMQRVLGGDIAEIEILLGELERNGVFSRTRKGVIYSRRIVRDAKNAEKSRKNGKLGGNPSLGKQKGKSEQVNQEDKGGLKPQKPEARSQREEREDKSSLERSSRFAEFWETYPHRHGTKKGKAPAEAKYRLALKAGASEQEIIDGAKAAHRHPDVVRGYSRDPVTWLNQSGWTDEIGSASKRGASGGEMTAMGFIREHN